MYKIKLLLFCSFIYNSNTRPRACLIWWLCKGASRGRRWEQIKSRGSKEQARSGEWELTERRWCLFSLWLVMGGCSQHKHMPSWLAHFLPHSTSLHWATQTQDTTAGPLYSLCLCMRTSTLYACSLLLWSTRSLNACYHGKSRTSVGNIKSKVPLSKTSWLKVKEVVVPRRQIYWSIWESQTFVLLFSAIPVMSGYF